MDEGVEGEPNWDLSAQPAPDFDVDQRVNWRLSKTAIGKTPSPQTCLGVALRPVYAAHRKSLS